MRRKNSPKHLAPRPTHNYGAKARVAILAGTMSLALLPNPALALPQQSLQGQGKQAPLIQIADQMADGSFFSRDANSFLRQGMEGAGNQQPNSYPQQVNAPQMQQNNYEEPLDAPHIQQAPQSDGEPQSQEQVSAEQGMQQPLEAPDTQRAQQGQVPEQGQPGDQSSDQQPGQPGQPGTQQPNDQQPSQPGDQQPNDQQPGQQPGEQQGQPGQQPVSTCAVLSTSARVPCALPHT